MKGRNKKRNIKQVVTTIIALLIAFIMVFSLIQPFLVSGKEIETTNSAVTIQGEIGFNKKYKLQSKTPVKIRLENTGTDFKGKIQVKINTSYSNYSKEYHVYSTTLELPRGSSKVVEMEIPLNVLKASHKVLLIDENGNEVANKTIYSSGVSPDSVLIASLSDSFESLNYIKQTEINTDSFGNHVKLADKFINLTEENFPKSKETLKAFNFIIINDYDTSKLSDVQIFAIEEWVKDGGVLILGTGTNFDKIFKKINKDIIEVDFRGMSEIIYKDTKEDIIFGQSRDSNIPLIIAETGVKDSEEVIVNDKVVAHVLRNEKGAVILNNFDLGLEPFTSFPRRVAYMQDIIYLYNKQSTENYYGYSNSNYIVERLPLISSSNNTPKILMVIVLIYAIVIGPILYIVLKKKDKREKGFYVIPLIAISVTIIVYIIGRSTIYRGPIMNTIALVQVENASDTAEVSAQTIVMAPNKGTISIQTDKDAEISPTQNNEYDRYYGSSTYDLLKKDKDLIEIQKGETTDIHFFETSYWNSNHFNENYNLKLNGVLDSDLYIDGKSIKGTITNNTGYDLVDTALIFNDSYNQNFESIKNNETADIYIKFEDLENAKDYYYFSREIIPVLKESEESKEKLYKSEVERQMLMDLYFNLKQNSSYQSFFPGSTIPVSQISVGIGVRGTSGMIIGGGSILPNSISSNKKINNTILMPNGFENQGKKIILNQKELSVSLLGFTEDNLNSSEITVNKSTTTSYNRNLFVFDLNLDFEKMSSYDFPYGIRNVSEISSTAQFDYYPYSDNSLYMYSPGELEFKFNVLEDSTTELFQIKWEKEGKQIFNFANDEFEELSSLPYAVDLEEEQASTENLYDYISEDGVIILRLPEAEGDITLPKIRLKGGR